jgi:hypothetical protein
MNSPIHLIIIYELVIEFATFIAWSVNIRLRTTVTEHSAPITI